MRAALAQGRKVCNVRNGFAGLIADNMASLRARDVGRIIRRGGAALGSARRAEYREDAGRLLGPVESYWFGCSNSGVTGEVTMPPHQGRSRTPGKSIPSKTRQPAIVPSMPNSISAAKIFCSMVPLLSVVTHIETGQYAQLAFDRGNDYTALRPPMTLSKITTTANTSRT